MTSRFLHVANGSSTTSTIRAAGIPGALSIWADPLYEGPVPGGLSDDELREVRERFLATPGVPVDPVNDLKRWRETIAAHDDWDELVMWFEHDLFDQLNLIQLLSWIPEQVPARKTVSLICIGSFPGRPNFKGLGELTPAELRPLLDIRQVVSEAQYELAGRAWRAFREPTPEPLDALCRTNTSALPFLAGALQRFLEEYPWTRDGLSRSERRLLTLAADGPIDLLTAFPRMQEGEAHYCMTDGSLAELADTLAASVPPLLMRTGDGSSRAVLRGGVTLTDQGRAVLAGEHDRIALCGIDRWLGGVHLNGAGVLWRWDPEQARITA